MSYANQFLRDFSPVFTAILKAVRLEPKHAEVEIIDEEDGSYSSFEPVDVRDVLEQFSEILNYLTIYTDRPAYFKQFAETMYEENGLIVGLFSKEDLRKTGQEIGEGHARKVTLDFEWEGACDQRLICPERYYIPIHKKEWLPTSENLDIIVPIGYNTMTVKSVPNKRKRPDWDRFEAAFYEEI